MLDSPAARRTRAAEVLGGLASGAVRLTVAARVPLSQGAQAHALLEGREVIGKVLLLP